MSKPIYPFWATGRNGPTPPPDKLPKFFRKKGSVASRELNSIIIDKKTGKFKKRTIENLKSVK